MPQEKFGFHKNNTVQGYKLSSRLASIGMRAQTKGDSSVHRI